MNLDISQWKEFKVSSIFTIHNGKGITKEEIEDNEGDFTVVQSGEENNGVLGKINLDYCKSMNYTLSEKPCLTVARSGSAGYVSFQLNGCVVGDSAKILLLDENIATVELYTFLQTLLTANRFKYAYGRKVTENKYMNDTLKLPIETDEEGKPIVDVSRKYSKDGYIPDWQWMENYIKSLHHKPLTTKNKTDDVLLFNVNEWQEFRFGNLISNINKSKALNKDDLIETNNKKHIIRYITRTGENNGCELLVDISTADKTYIQDKNAISIGDTTATCFYQDEDFITGDHMVIVRAEWLNKPLGLYVTSILNKEQYKYSYGRAFLMDRIKDTIIKLPIVRNSDKLPVIDESKRYSEQGYLPDWQWMEKYMKSLPYGDRL